MDPRAATCLIIRKNGEYLVGRVLHGEEMRWSCHVFDAWKTRKRDLAEEVARKVGGIVMLFNTVTGEKRIL